MIKLFSKNTILSRVASFIILVTFISSSVYGPQFAQAQVIAMPPAVLPSFPNQSFLQGLKIFPQDPFKFEFIVNPGQAGLENEKELKKSADKLIRYFLASLTVPEKDLWVNLSPYEKDRIISQQFGQTDMGRDMLAQDYVLKQLTASLMNPDEKLGKYFWDKVYAKVYEQFGTTNIPVDSFHKVWIVPQLAEVVEHEGNVIISQAKLKVMLEEDYEAMSNQKDMAESRAPTRDNAVYGSGIMEKMPSTNISNIVREIIIPQIEKEVNEGESFASLRQIYHSLILAAWYKRKLKQSILQKIYVDQNKIEGIRLDDKDVAEKIYQQYVKLFKDGAYDFVREEYDKNTQDIVPRRYFSGGLGFETENLDKALVIKEVETETEFNRLVQPSMKARFTTVGVLLSFVGKKGDKALNNSLGEPKVLRRLIGEKQTAYLEGDRGGIKVEIGEFPDKEIRLQIKNTDDVKGASVKVLHYLHQPEDIIQAVLILDALHQYEAGNIQLYIPDWKETGASPGEKYLLSILRFYADQIFIMKDDGSSVDITDTIEPIGFYQKAAYPLHIDRILYLEHRFRNSAVRAAEQIGLTNAADPITVDTTPEKRFIEMPEGLTGQNVILYNSTDNARQMLKTLITLVGLRYKNVKSISLINTYLGYQRQDRVSKGRYGEPVSANTFLRLIDRLIDKHFVVNAHFADQSGEVETPKPAIDQGETTPLIYNLNGFIPVAERLVGMAIHDALGIKDNPKDLPWDEAKKLGIDIKKHFDEHPIIIVAPDNGSRFYAEETQIVLQRLIKESYGVEIPVYLGYVPKMRDPQSGKTSRAEHKVLDVRSNQEITFLGNKPIKEAWALVIDDITDTGGTLKEVDYILVESLGLQWRRVLTGVVHGTLSQLLVPFQTGLSNEEIKNPQADTKPREEFISRSKESPKMPPRFLVSMKTIMLPDQNKEVFYHLSTRYLVEYVVKRVIQKNENFDKSIIMHELKQLFIDENWGALYTRAGQMLPKDETGGIHHLYLRALMELNEYEEAYLSSKIAVEKFPVNYDLKIDLLIAYKRNKLYERGIEYAKELIEQYPIETDAHFYIPYHMLIAFYDANDQSDEAIEFGNKYANNPYLKRDIRFHNARVLSYRDSGDFDNAWRVSRENLEKFPGNEVVENTDSTIYLKAGRYEEGSRSALRRLRNHPYSIHTVSIFISFLRNLDDSLRSDLFELLKDKPNILVVTAGYLANYRTQDNLRIIEQIKQHVDLPENFDQRWDRSILNQMEDWVEQEKWNELMDKTEERLDEDVDGVFHHMHLLALLGKKFYQEAVVFAPKAVSQFPDSYDLKIGLLKSYMYKEMYQEAIEYAEDLVKQYPASEEYKDVYNLSIETYIAARRYQDALDFGNTYGEKDGLREDFEFQTFRVKTLRRLRKFEEAFKLSRANINLFPGEKKVENTDSSIYLYSGRYQEGAKIALQRLLKHPYDQSSRNTFREFIMHLDYSARADLFEQLKGELYLLKGIAAYFFKAKTVQSAEIIIQIREYVDLPSEVIILSKLFLEEQKEKSVLNGLTQENEENKLKFRKELQRIKKRKGWFIFGTKESLAEKYGITVDELADILKEFNIRITTEFRQKILKLEKLAKELAVGPINKSFEQVAEESGVPVQDVRSIFNTYMVVPLTEEQFKLWGVFKIINANKKNPIEEGKLFITWARKNNIIEKAPRNKLSDKSVGGIDFTIDKLPLNIKSENGTENLFNIPITELNAIPGFTPVILYIHPTGNLLKFIGFESSPPVDKNDPVELSLAEKS